MCLLLCDLVVVPVAEHGDIFEAYLLALVPACVLVGFESGGFGAAGAVSHGGGALVAVTVEGCLPYRGGDVCGAGVFPVMGGHVLWGGDVSEAGEECDCPP